ncbi:MAG: tetratricopeptide repeat protein [Chloroflexota bacterium]
MYLDRAYRPRRRRRGGFPFWPFLLVVIIGIILYEQQPEWLVPQETQPTAVPTRGALSYLVDARRLLNAGAYNEALANYEEVLRLEPQNVDALVAQANVYMIFTDVETANDYATRAIEIDPDHVDGMVILARTLDWLGDYDSAINYALDALEIVPENPEALAVLGEIYADVGNWTVSENYLNQALDLDPTHTLALRNKAYLYEFQGEYETAIQLYEQAVASAPQRFDLYIELGRQYRVGLFDYEKANESYRKAVEVYESAVTLDALGFGLYNTGDHLQAVRVLRQAYELDDDYGPGLVHLGMALYARRNYEDAAPMLEKGINILGEDARIEHIYTLGLAHIYKEPTECDRAEPWLRRALDIASDSLPAIEGMNLCDLSY